MRRTFIKSCKKILSATVCAVTAAVFTIAGAGEVLADDAAQLVVSSVKGYEGDTVTVSVALKNNPGIAGTAFQLEYDTSVLEYAGVVMDPETEDVKDSIWAGPTMKVETPGVVTYANAREKNITKSGNLFEVQFKIADGASIGDSDLKIGGRLEFVNAAEQDIKVTPVNGKITVECKHAKTTDQTTEATCTADGKVVTTCDKCGKEVSVKTIPAKGHTFGEVEVEKEPTCTETGKGVKTCSVCGATEEVEIPAKGHAFGDVEVEKEPTCTEAGKGVKTCSVCGVTEEVEIPAKGHTFGEVVVETDPTETETGKGTKTCSVCGAKEEVVIPAKGQAATTPSTNEDGTTVSGGNSVSGDKAVSGNDKNKAENGKNETVKGNVQTGDNAGATAAALFMICAVSGSAAVIAYKKRAVR